jgi:protein-L-isoaspartate(D-aspartate) O-methyltransferase
MEAPAKDDPMDFTSARINMVESQVRTNDVTDVTIQEAMRAIHRERFVMPSRLPLAYADRFVEYADARWLMPPRDVAKLLQAVRPRRGERALAIAAPYAAAVMARMGAAVTALQDARSDAHTRLALEEEGGSVLAGDLQVPEGAWDVIVTEGAVAAVPDTWLQALTPGGRLGVVIRRGPVGKATVYTRAGDAFSARDVFDSLPPWLPGFEPKAAFAF